MVVTGGAAVVVGVVMTGGAAVVVGVVTGVVQAKNDAVPDPKVSPPDDFTTQFSGNAVVGQPPGGPGVRVTV